MGASDLSDNGNLSALSIAIGSGRYGGIEPTLRTKLEIGYIIMTIEKFVTGMQRQT